jgi:hypothetical protein
VIKDEDVLHSNETLDDHKEPIQVSEEEEPIPPVNNTQMTNNQPARSKYGCEFKPTKKYTEFIQQLTAKPTTREDFVEYNEEDKI